MILIVIYMNVRIRKPYITVLPKENNKYAVELGYNVVEETE